MNSPFSRSGDPTKTGNGATITPIDKWKLESSLCSNIQFDCCVLVPAFLIKGEGVDRSTVVVAVVVVVVVVAVLLYLSLVVVAGGGIKVTWPEVTFCCVAVGVVVVLLVLS